MSKACAKRLISELDKWDSNLTLEELKNILSVYLEASR